MSLIPSQTPDFKWLVYPPSAVPSRKIDAFVVADLQADLIQGTPSTWGGVFVKGTVGGGVGDWQRLGSNLTIQNAGFARFLPDGSLERFPQSPNANAFGGFYVIPTLRPLSAIVDGQGTPVANTQSFGWTTKSGQWQVVPGLAGTGTAVLNLGTSNIIEATTALPKNGGFEVKLDFATYDEALRGETFLRFGQNLRLALRQGQPPTIERQVTAQGALAGTWTKWKRLVENQTFTPQGTTARFSVSQIGGRMVCEWNNAAIWLLDENATQNNAAGVGTRSRGAIPQWGGLPLRLESNNCRVRAELGTLDHLNDAGTAPRVATITRTIPLSSAQTYEARMTEPVASGFVPGAGKMDVAVTHGDASISYTATITPDTTGIFSPCLANIYLTYAPVWVNGSGTPVDFSAAVTSGRVTLSQPPSQAGSEGSVNVDLELAAKKCPAALPLLKDFAPFEVSARWIYADGTPVSNYRGLMQGYLFGSDGAQPTYNTTTASFTLRDPMVRLHDESGIVDDNFCDLIADFQRVTKERTDKTLRDLQAGKDPDAYQNPFEDNTLYIPVTAGDYYGGDAVKYILSTQLGPTVAATLNGNGSATRFLPETHPALLNRFDMAGSVAGLSLAFEQTLGIGSLGGNDKGGFFPPPYGEDCLSWINKIGEDDQCVFFFGHVDRNTDTWPVPIYGKYEVFLDSAEGHRLKTDDASALIQLIEDARVQSRPETMINRVLVWSNPFGAEIPFAPAFVQGEARLASGPNAPHNSWARSIVLQEGYAKWITTAAQASAVAATVLLDIADASGFFPQYKTAGNANLLVGDVFFATGLKLNINDLWMRAGSVEHAYDVDANNGRWWETTVRLQPMTARQVARFQRNHAFEI